MLINQLPQHLTTTVNSFHQVNTLYDGMINCFLPLAQSSEASNETFTYKQALREPDYHDFIKAVVHKVHDHKKWDHWTCMQHSDMPENTKTIMSIRSFKRKWFPDRMLNKHTARLCAHGGLQTWVTNYWETYAPHVNWASVCLLLAVVKIHGLSSKSIDLSWLFHMLILKFLFTCLEVLVCMELPLGFDAPQNRNQKHYILQLNKSLYGLKQAGYNWFAKLCNGLLDCGFTQSNIDACIFFGKGCIILMYVDNCIIVGDLMDCIEALITSLHDGTENFILQDEGSINKYLRVCITQLDDSSFNLTQPFLIEPITVFLGINKGQMNPSR
jgi:hypothetical protein